MHADLIQHAQAVGGHVLVRGRYATFLTAAGTGYSAWGDLALTRWSADPVENNDGLFLYLRDLDSGVFWSLGQQPALISAERYESCFTASTAELRQFNEGIEARLDLCIAPDADLELRRVILRNPGKSPRRIEITSYAGVVINTWAADAAHPAFSKLFVQTEWVAKQGALVARRRPRTPGEKGCWLVHALAGEDGNEKAQPPQHETDRARFIGRGYSLAAPHALVEKEPLSGTVGNVLDPIVSLRCSLELAAGSEVSLTFLLGAAMDRETALDLVVRYASATRIEASFMAASSAASLLRPSALNMNRGRKSTRYYEPATECAAHSSKNFLPLQGAELRAGDEERGKGGRFESDAESLQFWNGYGGFNASGDEYVIRLTPDANGRLRLPPQPWVNVIANPQFGFLTSESGAGYTWSQNSRENRLTPWCNDPILDPHGEALYLRDEDSHRFWSLTPGPVPQPVPYEIRHGFGYSHYRHVSQGLTQEVWLFAAREEPVKLILIRLHNPARQPRCLSLFAYARLVLGVLPGDHARELAIEQDSATGALLAENHNREFTGRIAFAAVSPTDSVPIHISGDRAAFIGRHGSPACPAALSRDKILDGRLGTGLDPCFALQVTLRLEPGATLERAFLLGEAGSRDEVRRLIGHYSEDGAVAAALTEVRHAWRERLAAVRIQTPTPALDLMINGWAAYQTLSCRLWGRSAFYQSGGAFGFRDQLQDAAALIYHDPALTRQQLLLHAAHQFIEGDVLHWWHPPAGYGIRTRFSDDRLWLPWLAAFYGRATGDWSVFDEPVRFLQARELESGENEAFLTPEDSGKAASLYEHCCRALDSSLTQGAHGLPLMGSGDWNDGMNRVGREGRGESVWLGFFLYAILGDFIPVCGRNSDYNRARRYAAFRSHLAEALNEQGWDGEWYRRAWYDNGEALGSKASDECRIDALAQAWAVMSRAAPWARAEAAMDAVERHLISEPDGLIRLLAPPFANTPQDPGYIKGYVAGVRENGGQYTHAALWVVRALAELGRRDQAARLLEMLSPVSRTLTPEAVAVYRLEPFSVAADIYGVEPHVGRGGWSGYTGSAGWLLRVMLESILGLELVEGHALHLRPCIPDEWPGFDLRYQLPDGETAYEIHVRNPDGRARRVVAVEIDDRPGRIEYGSAYVPLFQDGLVHQVLVTLTEATEDTATTGISL
ncbi:MAG: glycosyl transferase [Candidatus Competibacteraceae bacterium]|nr:glycosyl transferase [Candidatus Competibacteraceae bacterium]MCP5125271.1 glycosyl transferase [Gammaproteobacteria bacterium]HRX71405.1 glycosyl transferase [Candidatus Competibacteraceae bacterium]